MRLLVWAGHGHPRARKTRRMGRAFNEMTMAAFENMPGKMKIPCSVFLDEMPSLRIELLDTAAPVFRRFGIRLVVVTQDLEKLRQAYPDSWEGFIGNAQCTIWMG